MVNFFKYFSNNFNSRLHRIEPMYLELSKKRVYIIILVLPEIFIVHRLIFLLRIVCNRIYVFIKKLTCIVIDKAHLV